MEYVGGYDNGFRFVVMATYDCLLTQPYLFLSSLRPPKPADIQTDFFLRLITD
jgi:hypothetical protein